MERCNMFCEPDDAIGLASNLCGIKPKEVNVEHIAHTIDHLLKFERYQQECDKLFDTDLSNDEYASETARIRKKIFGGSDDQEKDLW
jgi:hypothetical protein